ncbi:hypothetical protein KUCAC02_001625 [Chaenocephalus aceratus]|uniref:Uncharacterized protein n=1 Tax=Chaenocephalus aceratus TaxID=36190 RepID=A0ACB9XT93_CHAAC|nr:hypothetical protein KUCAC02_001625 [Chaenocephalus aceratus]
MALYVQRFALSLLLLGVNVIISIQAQEVAASEAWTARSCKCDCEGGETPTEFSPIVTGSPKVRGVDCMPECPYHKPLGFEAGSVSPDQITCSNQEQYTGWFSSWVPSKARLNSEGFGCAWLSKFQDNSQWVEIDLMEVKLVSGILTRAAVMLMSGSPSTASSTAQTKSSTGSITKTRLETTGCFNGNSDRSSSVQNLLRPPIVAHFIRIIPLGWHTRIALRLELLLCMDKMQINLSSRHPRGLLPKPHPKFPPLSECVVSLYSQMLPPPAKCIKPQIEDKTF